MSSPRSLPTALPSGKTAPAFSEVERFQDLADPLTSIDQDPPSVAFSSEDEIDRVIALDDEMEVEEVDDPIALKDKRLRTHESSNSDEGWEAIEESSTTEEKSELEDEEYVVDNTLPEDPAAQITYGTKIVYTLKKGGLIIGAALPPAALAVNAFCAFPHIKTAELSLAKIKELSSGMLALCIANGFSSYSINTILNLNTIPNAFQMFYDRICVNFRKHPGKNGFILLLAAGASVSAGAVGYVSFLSFGKTLAWTNFGTNCFIFFVTRFYGIVNALNRFEKWYSHRYAASPLAYSFEDMLSHLTDDYAHELEAFIKSKSTGVDEAVVAEVLMKLDEILQRDSKALNKRTHSETLAILFDLTLAVGASLSVLPVFAQKFLDGLDKLKALFTNEADSITFNEFSNGIKWLLSSLSIATSVLYAGQASLLRQTLVNAYDSVIDPKQTRSKKIAKGFGAGGLFLGNVMACTSLYNLTETSTNGAHYIAADVTPAGSTLAETNAILSGVGGFAVNAKLSFEKAFPAPKASNNPIIERVQSSADLPALARQKTETTPPLPAIDEETDVESIASSSMGSDSFAASRSFPSSASASSVVVGATSPTETKSNSQILEVTKWLKTNTLSKESLHKLHEHHATLFGKKVERVEPDSLKHSLLAHEAPSAAR